MSLRRPGRDLTRSASGPAAFSSSSCLLPSMPIKWLETRRCCMKQDRFLMGILIGIGALVVVALALFFTRQDKQTYRTGEAPEDVVFNYALAVTERDYQKAYGYLADLPNKPGYESFRQSFFNGMVSPNNVGVDVGTARVDGDEATVEVTMVYASSD